MSVLETIKQKKCFGCGECCKQLSWDERIKISIKSKTIILNKVCKFLDDNCNCLIYNKNRPNICKEYYCGAWKIINKYVKG